MCDSAVLASLLAKLPSLRSLSVSCSHRFSLPQNTRQSQSYWHRPLCQPCFFSFFLLFIGCPTASPKMSLVFHFNNWHTALRAGPAGSAIYLNVCISQPLFIHTQTQARTHTQPFMSAPDYHWSEIDWAAPCWEDPQMKTLRCKAADSSITIQTSVSLSARSHTNTHTRALTWLVVNIADQRPLLMRRGLVVSHHTRLCSFAYDGWTHEAVGDGDQRRDGHDARLNATTTTGLNEHRPG